MARVHLVSTIAFALGLSSFAFGQGGFGGAQGGQQGRDQRVLRDAARGIEDALSRYLNGDEIKSILTPGEFCEWKLKMKADQVVFAEASSDAFDPAIEILDDKNKTLASNDDRYPGDQRPLLMWRCEKEGEYLLHVRCFHDRSGGQFGVRFKVYDSVDLSSGQKVEKEIDGSLPFLLRVPMKAGQIKDVVADFGGDHASFFFNQVIAPDGLPEEIPSLGARISPIDSVLIAPVDGDYYLMETPSSGPGKRKILVGTREIIPVKPGSSASGLSGKASTNVPTIWQVPVKAGDLLRATLSDVPNGCGLVVAEAPDVSKYDLSKPETNPFIPHVDQQPIEPAFDLFAARARDSRVAVFRARRDTTLWLATNGAGQNGGQVSLNVAPAAADFGDDKNNPGKLTIADTDYWAFDAKAGDVMNLSSTTTAFNQVVIVRSPDLNEIMHTETPLDQASLNWRMIVQKPGRYLVAVSCLGDGGAGPYSLSRKVFHAKDFGYGKPAKGEIDDGQVQIWKFTATPDKPLLIHWSSSSWPYDVAICDDKGGYTDFQRQRVDANNQFGILKVDHPQTFVVILTGHGKASYSIDLGGIPGYK